MTADTITAIKKALEGVTPGPWELCAHLKHNDACSCGYRGVIYGFEPDGYAICQPGHEPAPEGQEGTEPPRYPRDVEIANMRFIAAVNPKAIAEILSTLESLQRDNEAMKSALRPFAIAADVKLCGEWRDDERFAQTDVGFYLNFGDLRRARTALASTGGEHHAE